MPAKGYKPMIPTQIPSLRYLLAFPTHSGEVIKNHCTMECGCTWVYAPSVTGRYDRPFALKFPYRNCPHYQMING
jgi:hypothetical protein